MNIRLNLLLLLLTIQLSANPISVDQDTIIKKKSENCLIFVNQESLKVSCEIQYEIVTRGDASLHIHVPVFCTVEQYQNINKTKEFVNAKIECEGVSYSPSGVFATMVDENGYPIFGISSLNSIIEVGCEFLIKTPARDKFSILVNYTQSLFEGKAQYLPLFENEISPDDAGDFKVIFFTASEFKLHLVTKHPYRSKSMERRIMIEPKHAEIIEVKIDTNEVVKESK